MVKLQPEIHDVNLVETAKYTDFRHNARNFNKSLPQYEDYWLIVV